MKLEVLFVVFVTLTFGSVTSIAQTPSGATGQCKDGTYTSAASKSGACSGHKGVQTWFAASGGTAPSSAPTGSSTPAAAASPLMPAAAPLPSSPVKPPAASSPTKAESQSKAAGGGPGVVWVNTASNVYHCYGAEYYGTTKNGKYMTEADAKDAGARADHGKACTK